MPAPPAVKVAGAALLVAAAGGLALPAVHAAAPSCVVGAVGTASTVTVSGFGAGRACRRLLLAADPPGSVYLRTAPIPASDVVLCAFDAHGLRWTVRDRRDSMGGYMIAGRATCATLPHTISGQA